MKLTPDTWTLMVVAFIPGAVVIGLAVSDLRMRRARKRIAAVTASGAGPREEQQQ